MKDPTSLLRTATRRAKSDVANKLISMFLHELSRKVARGWQLRVESEAYADLVRQAFQNRCPYCDCELFMTSSAVEHLDGMNRYRVGLHVPGNVLISCKKCNNEKRRDDSRLILTLADSGWESFLSHDSTRCPAECGTCRYWLGLFPDQETRKSHLSERLHELRRFRRNFPEFEAARIVLIAKLPELLGSLYTDCQSFASREIASMLEHF